MMKLDVQGEVVETEMKSTPIINSKSSDYLIDSDSNDEDVEIQNKKQTHSSNKSDNSNIQSIIMNFINIQWIEINAMIKEQRFRDEIIRSSYAGFALFCMVSVMTVTQIFSDRWYENHAYQIIDNAYVYATDPLYDRILISLPDWGDQRDWLSDFFLSIYIAISMTFTIFFPGGKPKRYQSFIALRRMAWLVAILFFCRTWTIFVTTVPNPLQSCVPKYGYNTITNLTYMVKMSMGKISACTDNIFSGHTSLCVSFLFINLKFSGRPLMNIFYTLQVIVILTLILFTRLHYTIDILIALFMASFTYFSYQYLLLVAIDKKFYIVAKNKKSDDNEDIIIDEENIILDTNCNNEIDITSLEDEKSQILISTVSKMAEYVAFMDGLDIRHPNYNRIH